MNYIYIEADLGSDGHECTITINANLSPYIKTDNNEHIQFIYGQFQFNLIDFTYKQAIDETKLVQFMNIKTDNSEHIRFVHG